MGVPTLPVPCSNTPSNMRVAHFHTLNWKGQEHLSKLPCLEAAPRPDRCGGAAATELSVTAAARQRTLHTSREARRAGQACCERGPERRWEGAQQRMEQRERTRMVAVAVRMKVGEEERRGWGREWGMRGCC